MVKKIMRDPLFLAQKSVDATEDDKQVVTDLLDTLRANFDHCVGTVSYTHLDMDSKGNRGAGT